MANSKDWRNDPPTEKQLNFLRSTGIETSEIATKGEASDIIDNLSLGKSMTIEAYREMRSHEAAIKNQYERQQSSNGLSEYLKERINQWQAEFGEAGYFGYSFKRPNKQQVRAVIESLDQSNPGWDDTGGMGLGDDIRSQLAKEADEVFLAVFEQLNPQLRKASARSSAVNAKSATKQGCIVSLFLLLTPIAIVHWYLIK